MYLLYRNYKIKVNRKKEKSVTVCGKEGPEQPLDIELESGKVDEDEGIHLGCKNKRIKK